MIRCYKIFKAQSNFKPLLRKELKKKICLLIITIQHTVSCSGKRYHWNHFHATEHSNRTKISSMRAPVNRWIIREATIRA